MCRTERHNCLNQFSLFTLLFMLTELYKRWQRSVNVQSFAASRLEHSSTQLLIQQQPASSPPVLPECKASGVHRLAEPPPPSPGLTSARCHCSPLFSSPPAPPPTPPPLSWHFPGLLLGLSLLPPLLHLLQHLLRHLLHQVTMDDQNVSFPSFLLGKEMQISMK